MARLAPGERVILAEAWGLFLLVGLGLRILSFSRLLALCQPAARSRPRDSTPRLPASLPRLTWLVEVAGRYAPGKGSCLEQALVVAWLLGRRGVATRLRIGVARRDGRLQAHAWVELDRGVTLGVLEGQGYEPLLPAR